MSLKFARRRMIPLLVILLLLILIGERGFKVLRKYQHPHDSIPSPTLLPSAEMPKSSIISKVEESIQKVMKPVSERSAEQKAKASEQFGAALERVGIQTQAEASR